MKIRAGFVSNSSSSSFVIIGNKIPMEDIKKYDNVWMLGQNSEYREATELNDEIKDAILENEIDGEYWKAYFVAFDLGDLTKDCVAAMAQAGGDFEVKVIETGGWNAYEQDGLEGFLANYLDEYEDEEEEE